MAEYVENETDRDIIYPEALVDQQVNVHLDLTNTEMELDFKNIDVLPNEEYALLRRQGFGTSDASVILRVNPYKSIPELIAEKTRTTLSAKEKAIGDVIAVRKGNDLEPLILEKFEAAFNQKTWKPSDMYVAKEFPFMKFNFDGVTGTPTQYIPAEMKVVTTFGEKNYIKKLAMYDGRIGFRPLPENYAITNNSIMTKAALYGIPPYYYTQLQQQIYGLRAPFGYLCVLFEKDWTIRVYFVHRDEQTLTQLITEGYKIWTKIETIKARA